MGGDSLRNESPPHPDSGEDESEDIPYAYTSIISFFLLNANFFYGIVKRSRTAPALGAFSWITIRVENEGLMAIRKVGKYFQVDYYDPNGKRIRKNFKKKKDAKEIGR